jgi:hypothetical protein
MTFDPSNPATYPDDFKSLLRQRGLAGKEIDVAEVQNLYSEVSGAQTKSTRQATDLFASMPDPTPNASAMGANTFAGTAPTMDLTVDDTDVLTGRSLQKDPIMSTVQEVSQAEAQEMEAQDQGPSMEDQIRTFGQERLLPVVEDLRSQRDRINSTKYRNSYEKKFALDALEGKAARNITKLEEAGLWGSAESATYRSLIEEEKSTPEEALLRTFNAKMNPQVQAQGSGAVSDDALVRLKSASEVMAVTQKSLDIAPDDPEARRAHAGAVANYNRVQKEAGLSSGPDLMEAYRETNRNLSIIKNARDSEVPSIILDGEVVTNDAYDQAALVLQSQLGTYESSPDFLEQVPVLDETKFKTKEEWNSAIKKSGGVYRDAKGRLVTPERFAEEEKKARFTQFKADAAAPTPVVTAEGEADSGIGRGEKTMIRRMIEDGQDLSKTRFSPEDVASVRQELNDGQIENALRSLYAGNSWASAVGLRNPMIKDEDLSGVVGRTDDPDAAKFLSEIDPETVKRVYEKTGRLQGLSAGGLKNSDGTWSEKVDSPDKVLSRIRALASTRVK